MKKIFTILLLLSVLACSDNQSYEDSYVSGEDYIPTEDSLVIKLQNKVKSIHDKHD